MTEQTIPPLSSVERGALIALVVALMPSIAFLGYLLIFHGLWQAAYAVLLPVFLAAIIWQFRAALRRMRPLAFWPASLRFWLLGLGFSALGALLGALFSLGGSGLSMGALVLRLGQYLALEVFSIGGAIFVCGLIFCRIRFARLEMLALLVVYALFTKGMLAGFFIPGAWLNAAIMLPIGIIGAVLSFLPAVLAAGQQPRSELALFARQVMVICAMLLATFICLLVASSIAQTMPGLFPPAVLAG